MKTGLKDFLNQPVESETSPSAASIEALAGEINPQETDLDVTGNSKPDLLVKLGKKLDSLKELMKFAEIRFDNYARKGLKALKEAFPSQRTSIQKVVLPKELVDHYGGNADELQFGAQTITSDAQFEKLKKEVEVAKKYLGPDINLHLINYPNGKPPVAVVMGVDAEEFNAVITAERKKTQLEEAIVATRKEMMRSAPGVGQQNEQNLEMAANMASKSPIKSASLGEAPDRVHVPGQGKERGGREISRNA